MNSDKGAATAIAASAPLSATKSMEATSRYDKLIDKAVAALTGAAALLILLVIAGVFVSLVLKSWPAIDKFGVINFLRSSEWNPVKENFGAAASIYGTMMTTVLSLVFAIPLALGIAVFITEIAPSKLKGSIGVAIELLASIPSIIYGMWGLFTLSPIMGNYIEPFLKKATAGIPLVQALFMGTPMGIDVLTASLILSIMIIPFAASISRDAFMLTPEILKESAYSVGATQWEVVKDVIIPYSKTGVMGGIILSLGRALGETMAVAFVLGNSHKISASLLDSASTITVTLANEFAEADGDMYLSSLFYLALVLFIISFIMLGIARIIMRRGHKDVRK